MNELQRQKAIQAIEKQKAKEHKKMLAMMFHLGAFTKLHCMGVLLPYKVLYGLEKQEQEGTFAEIPPNPYYPHPAITLATKWSYPKPPEDTKGLPLNEHGFPDLKVDNDFRIELEAYKQREAAEKTPIERWGYWYGRFLIEYDIPTFTDFDYWGKVPEDAEEKKVIDGLRAACLEVWHDCKEHPENYNFEPIPRLEEHKAIYDVDYGYI
jgi:hypothetical protein